MQNNPNIQYRTCPVFSRSLDKLSVRYELREYEVDPDDLSAAKVAMLFINSYDCDAGLEIAELAISDTTASK